MVMRSTFQPGDPVVFRMSKLSSKPGKRAQDVSPAVKGDYYSYEVDKFWVVAETRADGKLLLKTRRGKEHVLDADNPRLRHANWWERLLYRHRFPHVSDEPAASERV